ncbi:hypothetical protein T492DRAFT_871285 [Pavlovales sp. CCMP2436]|nr:hypothetical protein T492DRAFT_871285 [Pavlovales sp. CCMP2436]
MGTELRVLLAALDSATRALTPSVVWVGMAAAALRPLLRLTGRGPEEEEEEEEEGEEEAQDDVDFDFTESRMLAPRWPAGVSALVNAIEGSRESTDGLRTLLSIGAHVPPAAVEAEMASPQKTADSAVSA